MTDSTEGGWQLVVFRVGLNGNAKLKWKSGRLADSFAVSSGDELGTPIIGGEQVVTFSGCAAHACPEVFAVLLYVPSLNTTFSETHRGKDFVFSAAIGAARVRRVPKIFGPTDFESSTHRKTAVIRS
ncbi:MAG: hypothetical protein ACRD8A_08715 [Candidatus Acidiferrales bacterium]